jgi:hypothetical protein
MLVQNSVTSFQVTEFLMRNARSKFGDFTSFYKMLGPPAFFMPELNFLNARWISTSPYATKSFSKMLVGNRQPFFCQNKILLNA